MAYCMKCKQLKEKVQMAVIFTTGFVRVNGVDEPIGTCQECASGQEKTQESESEHTI